MLITYKSFYEWHNIYLRISLRLYVDSAGMEDANSVGLFEPQTTHVQIDESVEMKGGW